MSDLRRKIQNVRKDMPSFGSRTWGWWICIYRNVLFEQFRLFDGNNKPSFSQVGEPNDECVRIFNLHFHFNISAVSDMLNDCKAVSRRPWRLSWFYTCILVDRPISLWVRIFQFAFVSIWRYTTYTVLRCRPASNHSSHNNLLCSYYTLWRPAK